MQQYRHPAQHQHLQEAATIYMCGIPIFFVPPFWVTILIVGLRPIHRRRSPTLAPSTRPSRPSQKSKRSNTSLTSARKHLLQYLGHVHRPGVKPLAKRMLYTVVAKEIKTHLKCAELVSLGGWGGWGHFFLVLCSRINISAEEKSVKCQLGSQTGFRRLLAAVESAAYNWR